MSGLDYRHSEQAASLCLDSGATIHASKVTRQRDGGLSAIVYVVSPEGPLGGAHVLIGDARRRKDFANSLAGANGLSPEGWNAELTVFYLGLESALSQVQDLLVLEDPGVLDVSTLEEPGPRVDTVRNILPAGKITSVFSDGGTGKSFLSNMLAQCVVLGVPFLGELATVAGDVLYLDFEDDSEEFTRRAYQIARGLELDGPPPGLFYQRANKPLPEIFFAVLHYVSEAGISLVIIDSFGAACGGEAEGSRDSIALMQLLQILPCTVLLIDHEPKARDGRGPTQYGSVYKRNLSRSQLRLEDRGWPETGRHALLLRHTKLNSGLLHGGLPLYLCFEGGKVWAEKADANDESFREDTGVEEVILDVLRELGKATANDIAEYSGKKADSIKNALTGMVRSKRVKLQGKQGRAYLYERSDGED